MDNDGSTHRLNCMRKAFKYRLYPTRKQAAIMAEHLEECRMLYNHFVVDRQQAYKDREDLLSLYDQHKRLPFLKEDRPSLKQVHSQVLQNVAVRVDLAFKRSIAVVGKAASPAIRASRGWDATIASPIPKQRGSR